MAVRLNSEQQIAVDHEGSAVVLAGPGSGKTQTLVMKVARLLSETVREPHGVACLTYNTDAVAEFTSRLRQNGIRPGRRLFLGTVHGFCLTRVIRPYCHLAAEPGLRQRAVLTQKQQLAFRQRALEMRGVNEQAQWFETTLSNIRKDIACGDDLTAHDPRHIEVAVQYEDLLREHDRIDFDAMTFEGLRIVENHPAIADLIVARYPWLAVDEYQDLGGALHRLLLSLQAAGAHVFAVGDPDQCVYEFSGARPSTVTKLLEIDEFLPVHLKYNYRNGTTLIASAQAALAQTRTYEADPDRLDPGEVILHRCPDGLKAHVSAIINETLPDLVNRGVRLDEIAILYPGKGPLLDLLAAELEASDTPHRLERESRFPTSPSMRWLQRCASFALSTPGSAESLTELAAFLLRLSTDAGALLFKDELRLKATLFSVLDGEARHDDELFEWLSRVAGLLDLTDLLLRSGNPDEAESLTELIDQLGAESRAPLTIADFASGAVVEGRVVVTTYHSSKGRQFDVVLLPGLQQTLVPRARWDPRTRQMETKNMEEERRLFYVALTRCREMAVLYYSDSFKNKKGYRVEGHSIFIDEIALQLGMDA